MRSLNLDQLRALETVVELASFTLAAKRLNLSQSTISVQIRELEQRFRLRLVERHGKRVAPTAAGRELIDHARRIAAATALAEDAMQRRREGVLGEVRIGATTTGLNSLLAPILEVLRRTHANIDFTIRTGNTVGMVEGILDDEIDFALVNLPVRERQIYAVPLRAEPLVAIFPADTPSVPRQVTPAFLVHHRLLLESPRAHIRALVLDWFSPATRQLRPAMTLDNFDTIVRMVAIGLGASVVPRTSVSDHLRREDIIVRPLEPRLHRTLGLLVHRQKVMDRAMRIFRDAVVAAKEV
jgi:DNA-binding transcriptional LysR family regulator